MSSGKHFFNSQVGIGSSSHDLHGDFVIMIFVISASVNEENSTRRSLSKCSSIISNKVTLILCGLLVCDIRAYSFDFLRRKSKGLSHRFVRHIRWKHNFTLLAQQVFRDLLQTFPILPSWLYFFTIMFNLCFFQKFVYIRTLSSVYLVVNGQFCPLPFAFKHTSGVFFIVQLLGKPRARWTESDGFSPQRCGLSRIAASSLL